MPGIAERRGDRPGSFPGAALSTHAALGEDLLTATNAAMGAMGAGFLTPTK